MTMIVKNSSHYWSPHRQCWSQRQYPQVCSMVDCQCHSLHTLKSSRWLVNLIISSKTWRTKKKNGSHSSNMHKQNLVFQNPGIVVMISQLLMKTQGSWKSWSLSKWWDPTGCWLVSVKFLKKLSVMRSWMFSKWISWISLAVAAPRVQSCWFLPPVSTQVTELTSSQSKPTKNTLLSPLEVQKLSDRSILPLDWQQSLEIGSFLRMFTLLHNGLLNLRRWSIIQTLTKTSDFTWRWNSTQKYLVLC